MEKETIKVLMLGADRSVKGGVSGVVNNYYAAGIEDYVDIKYIGTMVDGSKLRKLFKAAEAYCKFLMCYRRYDIIHVNMASDNSYYRKLFFIKRAKKAGKKLVIHQHGGDVVNFYDKGMQGKKRQKMAEALNGCDRFIVLDSEWVSFWEQFIDKDKIRVLSNGVFMPDEEPTDESYDNHNIVFLGRICRDKGVVELVDAVTNLKDKYPDIRLYIGGNMEETDLESVFSGKEDFIKRLGWISADERNRLMHECSIFSLPSYYEGLPLSAIEAMSYGRAVVATRAGGLGRIFNSGSDGILVEPKSEKQLEEALDKVLSDSNLRHELGAKARAKALSKYDIKALVKELVSIYREI